VKDVYRSCRATRRGQVVAIAMVLCVVAPVFLLGAGLAWETVAAIVVAMAALGATATAFAHVGELRARTIYLESAFDDAVRRCDTIALVNQELAAAGMRRS
jgi:hypothetical protein